MRAAARGCPGVVAALACLALTLPAVSATAPDGLVAWSRQASSAPDAAPLVIRLPNNPIIRPEMLPASDGDNINGPSLVRVPAWIEHPLGRYYLYFGHHSGTYIRMAYADHPEGPWTIHAPGVLRLQQVPAARGHVSSPDVVIDDQHREVRLYFHAPSVTAGGQKTVGARSTNGLDFTASDEVLGIFYMRVFQWNGWWYGMAKGGLLYRSRDGLTAFERGPNPLPGSERRDADYNDDGPRHVAVHRTGNRLHVYYTSIGDAPERIYRTTVALTPDWTTWRASAPVEVLRPELEYEGATLPVRVSKAGAVHGREHALRDPATFMDVDGRVYLIYSVAGESGLAIAAVREP